MFKVGDNVVDVSSGYTLDSECKVTTGVVTSVCNDGYRVLFDGLDTSYFCFAYEITIPVLPRKMHPDDFVNAVNDFAKDNGFNVKRIEFHGVNFSATCLPCHEYFAD